MSCQSSLWFSSPPLVLKNQYCCPLSPPSQINKPYYNHDTILRLHHYSSNINFLDFVVESQAMKSNVQHCQTFCFSILIHNLQKKQLKTWIHELETIRRMLMRFHWLPITPLPQLTSFSQTTTFWVTLGGSSGCSVTIFSTSSGGWVGKVFPVPAGHTCHHNKDIF